MLKRESLVCIHQMIYGFIIPALLVLVLLVLVVLVVLVVDADRFSACYNNLPPCLTAFRKGYSTIMCFLTPIFLYGCVYLVLTTYY